MRVIRPVRGILSAVVVTAVLTGCAATNEDFWQEAGAALSFSNQTDLAYAALAKAEYGNAERLLEKALRVNPDDSHAYLAQGILYANTGRPAMAREAYQAAIEVEQRPPEPRQQAQGQKKQASFSTVAPWAQLDPQPVAEVARAHLGRMGVGDGWPPARSSSMPGSGGGGNGAVTGMNAMGDTMAPAGPRTTTNFGGQAGATEGAASAQSGMATTATAPGAMDEGRANVVRRFEILDKLLEEGLVTEDEYRNRRSINIGALLPLTSPPPAAGLERPVPTAQQVIDRLKALRRSFELRAISGREHAVERQMILDALMPAEPEVFANPPPPPTGLMEAAARVAHLERLRSAGLISSDQMRSERSAIERSLQLEGALPTTGGGGDGGGPRMLVPDGAAPQQSQRETRDQGGPSMAVHLASYRSEPEARAGWSVLKKKFNGLLGNLSSEINSVNLGPGKGTFYRLKAGPVSGRSTAEDICRELKRQGQYCEVAIMG